DRSAVLSGLRLLDADRQAVSHRLPRRISRKVPSAYRDEDPLPAGGVSSRDPSNGQEALWACASALALCLCPRVFNRAPHALSSRDPCRWLGVSTCQCFPARRLEALSVPVP